MSRYKDLIKDTFIFALGSFGSKAIVFLLVPLYTNVLTSKEYGTADLVLTFSQLLMPIMCLAIYNAIIRFGLENKEQPENTLLVGVLIWLIGCILLLFFIPLLGWYDAIAPWCWYLYLHVNASILLTLSQMYLKVKGENLKYSIISILQTTILAGLNILLLVFFHSGVKGYLLSNSLANLISALLAIFGGHIIRDLKQAKLDLGLMKNMVCYSAPLIMNNIAWWIIQSSDKIMIEAYVGAAALGLYTVATRIPSLINVVVSVFQEAWNISSIVEMDSTNDESFYSNVFQMYTVGIFFICIAINTIIKPFMKIYVGKTFYDAWRMVPMLVVAAAAFSAVAAFYGALYGALKKSVNNMISTLLAAIVNIVMNYICIYLVGAIGAVIGTLVSYMFLAIFRMFDVNRFLNIYIDYKIYVMNCVLVIIEAILVTVDFHGYMISCLTVCFFVIINRKILNVYIQKSIMLLQRNKKM